MSNPSLFASGMIGGIIGGSVGIAVVAMLLEKQKKIKKQISQEDNASRNSKKGFKPYWELSHKDKFRRTVYSAVFGLPVLLILSFIYPAFWLLFGVTSLGCIVQLIFTYNNWKKSEKLST